MFNHKYADQGDFDTMNETLRRCAEHVDNEDGWDDDDDGDMIYWTAAGRKKLNLKELVQLMFDAEVLDYFAKSYIGTKQAYNDGFY
ncbi:hypothetical protein N9E35_01410 [Candidatus Marinimicrobia bacterium]|nr:hypothetical protein [Candidatus Neomarinimicrobiota bacterium]